VDEPGVKKQMNIESASCSSRRCSSGVTLVEVVISMAIAAITISSIVAGYVFSARQLEQSACFSAADFMARQRIEQARSAKWDPLADPPVNELVASNFPVVVSPLDIPVAANNPLNATNTTTITTVSTNPPLKMIRVDCVWWLLSRGPFTNTLTAYRAPDQ
jgi:type II secretory pathway pseudopilin PulG